MWRIILSLMLTREEHTQLTSIYRLYLVFIILIFLLSERAVNRANKAKEYGFDQLLENHKEAWGNIWRNADIQIKGDVSAQQAIRFNIFHLYQTYTGKNVKLNIGPKGFTGEKYGGATYWDTEAYCLPFFLKQPLRE